MTADNSDILVGELENWVRGTLVVFSDLEQRAKYWLTLAIGSMAFLASYAIDDSALTVAPLFMPLLISVYFFTSALGLASYSDGY